VLVIRAEQMTAFEKDAERKFLESAIRFLQEEAPEVVEEASPEELLEFTAECLRRARSHGIDDGHCVRQFMLFATWRGLGFDEEPWARAILKEERRSQLARIAYLEDHLLSAMAEEEPDEPE
jgi:hypothetical protein